MKNIMLLCALCLFTFGVQAQQKAIGDIKFGMSPKETKKSYRSNKQNHSLKFGEWNFYLNLSSCKYDESGLYQVSLYAQEVEFVKSLTAINAGNLLVDMKNAFTKAGYEVVEQHILFPKVMMMRYDEFCLVLKNKEKEKIVKIRIDKRQRSFSDNYPIWLDIVPFSYEERIANKNKSNAESLDQKL